MTSCRMCPRTVQPSVRAKRGQQCQPALHLFRALPHQDVVPDVITHSAGIGAGEKEQQCQQASHLLREMQHHDIVPDVITNYAAISAGAAVPTGLIPLTSDAAQ